MTLRAMNLYRCSKLGWYYVIELSLLHFTEDMHKTNHYYLVFIDCLLLLSCYSLFPVDELCPDHSGCPRNYYCYIYSITGEEYCALSCSLNNGGCGTLQCVMIDDQLCTTSGPCPQTVQCHLLSECFTNE